MAKEQGYVTELVYVGLESATLARKRVKIRVKKGGHGVDAELVNSRYKKSLNNLMVLINEFDIVHLYDNTKMFNEIYYKNKDKIIFNETKGINWAQKVIKE